MATFRLTLAFVPFVLTHYRLSRSPLHHSPPAPNGMALRLKPTEPPLRPGVRLIDGTGGTTPIINANIVIANGSVTPKQSDRRLEVPVPKRAEVIYLSKGKTVMPGADIQSLPHWGSRTEQAWPMPTTPVKTSSSANFGNCLRLARRHYGYRSRLQTDRHSTPARDDELPGTVSGPTCSPTLLRCRPRLGARRRAAPLNR